MVIYTLLACKPQLMAPIDAEKFVIAQTVARHGSGLCWRPIRGAEIAVRKVMDEVANLTASTAAIRSAYSKNFNNEQNAFLSCLENTT